MQIQDFLEGSRRAEGVRHVTHRDNVIHMPGKLEVELCLFLTYQGLFSSSGLVHPMLIVL